MSKPKKNSPSKTVDSDALLARLKSGAMASMGRSREDIDLELKKRVDGQGYYSPEETTHPSALENQFALGGTPQGIKERPLIPDEPLKEGEQYRFHFDMSRCIGCECCVVACNEQNGNPEDVLWRRVGEIEGGQYPATKRYHLSMGCNHCVDPSCLTGCPTDAYEKLESDGIVKHNEEECIGCQYCTWNCPYGVPQFNKERRIVTKCDMCHSRLGDGLAPACVSVCPEEAIRIEKVNIKEWKENHSEANAPETPDASLTISTTRITLPEDLPEDTFKLNHHHVEPEHAHYSLIFLTVLTQLATGGFFSLWLTDVLSNFISFLRPHQEFIAFGAAGMLGVTGLALFASVFHLGRPLHAWKALRMWKRSWLSREVLLFSIFSFLGGAYAVTLLAGYFLNFSIPSWIPYVIGGLVTLSGIAGVYASAKIYMVPARPAWNTYRTPFRFFLTGLILGPLFGMLLYAGFLFVTQSGVIEAKFLQPIAFWLVLASVAAFLHLGVLFSRFFHATDKQSYEDKASTILLTRRFKNLFFVRIGLLLCANFMIPLWIFSLFSFGDITGTLLVTLLGASFFMSLIGEGVGRYLFFVTVVPKDMPGSFFSQKVS